MNTKHATHATHAQEAYRFFYKYGAHSWNPKSETKQQGRARCARMMAAAEAWASEHGVSCNWQQDDTTSREWTDEGPEYYTWVCVAEHTETGETASVGGVDFGHCGDKDATLAEARAPWGDPYKRVIEAELASELFATVSAYLDAR